MAEKFNITDKELAEALEISLIRLYEIFDLFDSNLNDDWEVNLNEHFEWSNRSFSSKGALVIWNYVNSFEKRSFIRRFVRWITGRDHKFKKTLIAKEVFESLRVHTIDSLENSEAIASKIMTKTLMLGMAHSRRCTKVEIQNETALPCFQRRSDAIK